jgi:rhamnose transport system permease protein
MSSNESMMEPGATPGGRRIGASRWVMAATAWETVLGVILVAIFILNSAISPYFLDLGNMLDATTFFLETAIIALPMMLVIICADIDISVASIISLSSVFMGMAAQEGHVPLFWLPIIGILVGVAAGFLNGILITGLNIPSIAVTIGTLSLYRGISYVILGDKAYTKYPASFEYFGQGYVGPTHIPFELVLFLVLAVIFGLLLHRTPFGRKVYTVGNNSTAARFSGVRVQRVRLTAFTLNGLMSGVAAVLLTSRIMSTRPNIAEGWELQVITIVVMGGVSIMGGKGNIFGVILSIFSIGFLRYGMSLVNIPGTVMNIVIGFLLIIAIMLPGALASLRRRLIVRAAHAGSAGPGTEDIEQAG